MSPRPETCENRIEAHLAGRLADLRNLWNADAESGDADALTDYGLGFDYVPPFTFSDQPEGYFRYQLSWGGPSDEFRFFVNPDFSCHRIEYWFLDWFDGACRTMSGDEAELLMDIWNWFRDTGIVESAYAKAQAP
jgi:hypothetical protein